MLSVLTSLACESDAAPPPPPPPPLPPLPAPPCPAARSHPSPMDGSGDVSIVVGVDGRRVLEAAAVQCVAVAAVAPRAPLRLRLRRPFFGPPPPAPPPPPPPPPPPLPLCCPRTPGRRGDRCLDAKGVAGVTGVAAAGRACRSALGAMMPPAAPPPSPAGDDGPPRPPASRRPRGRRRVT